MSGPDDAPREPGAPVSQAEIDAVLADPTLDDAGRVERLSTLRQRVLDAEHRSGDEAHAPLGMRIMDALSMLAEGGHDYRDRENESATLGAPVPGTVTRD